jgi:hypothetical protein
MRASPTPAAGGVLGMAPAPAIASEAGCGHPRESIDRGADPATGLSDTNNVWFGSAARKTSGVCVESVPGVAFMFA